MTPDLSTLMGPSCAYAYAVSLVDRRRNFRVVANVEAATALDAVSKAKAQHPDFQEVESCVLVKVNC